MTIDAHKETLAFQTEVSQVLDLVIRSLYSNKEIFLRELVSNALRRRRKAAVRGAHRRRALRGRSRTCGYASASMRDNRTVTVSDNGIGMSRQEVTETIGTIASSGTRKFLESLTGDNGPGQPAHRPVRRWLLFRLHRRRSRDPESPGAPGSGPSTACAGNPTARAATASRPWKRPRVAPK